MARSNRILERLRGTAGAFRALTAQLSALPMHRVADVGGERVGIVHGDADSLAGWGFSQEVLGTPGGIAAADCGPAPEAPEEARVAHVLERAGVSAVGAMPRLVW